MAAPPQPAWPPQPQPIQQAPPQYMPPAQDPYAVPPQKQGLPTWVMGVISFVVFMALGGGLYYYMQGPSTPSSKDKAPSEATAGVVDKASAGPANPIQKNIEVVGIRWTTQSGKPAVKFVVVNHSAGPLTGLEGTVTFSAAGSKDSLAVVPFQVKSLAGFASQDVTAGFDSALKPYELPDWQTLTTRVQITAP